MRSIVLITLLVAFATCSTAKTAGIKSCDQVDCSSAPTQDSCKGRLEANTSMFGCCNSCVVSVGMFGECQPYVQGVSTVRYECPAMSVCFNKRCIALP